MTKAYEVLKLCLKAAIALTAGRGGRRGNPRPMATRAGATGTVGRATNGVGRLAQRLFGAFQPALFLLGLRERMAFCLPQAQAYACAIETDAATDDADLKASASKVCKIKCRLTTRCQI